MMLAPEPQHGVSGYNTTGTTGDYQFQFHDHVDLRILDPAASRYSLQQRGGSKEITKSGEDFNAEFNDPRTNYTTPQPNSSQFNSEPDFVELEKLQLKHASKIKSHVLQRSKLNGIMKTYVENKIYEGFGQYDPQVQNRLRDPGSETDYIPSAYQPKKQHHKNWDVKMPVRQNQQHYPSHQEDVYNIEGIETPYGQEDMNDMSNQTTNELINVSNTGAGTHPQHGENMVHTMATNPPAYMYSGTFQKSSLYNVAGLDQPPLPDIRPTGYIIPLEEKTVMEGKAGTLQQRYL